MVSSRASACRLQTQARMVTADSPMTEAHRALYRSISCAHVGGTMPHGSQLSRTSEPPRLYTSSRVLLKNIFGHKGSTQGVYRAAEMGRTVGGQPSGYDPEPVTRSEWASPCIASQTGCKASCCGPGVHKGPWCETASTLELSTQAGRSFRFSGPSSVPHETPRLFQEACICSMSMRSLSRSSANTDHVRVASGQPTRMVAC